MTSTTASLLRLDSRAVQVLAHPLRSRLVKALRQDGPATATALAETLGTNTGATSYHLRKLASVGLVEETGEGRGRERPWRAATEMHAWTERDVADDPSGRAASDWLRRHYLRGFVDRYEAWLDGQGGWPLAWQDVAVASDYAIRLSPARLADFQAEFEALTERYRVVAAAEDGAATPQGPGSGAADDDRVARTVEIHLHVFPLIGHDR